MAKKGSGDTEINLDSFLDIMTCLVGVLVLIIILTGVDASQIKVLIPTPMEYSSDKRPHFLECRNNQLFMIPLADIRTKADNTLKSIAEEAAGDPEKLLSTLSQTTVKIEHYEVDLTYLLLGQLAIVPIPDSSGYPLEDYRSEGPNDWFGRVLSTLNKEEEMLTFLVRDDSFRVFKIARALAWIDNVEVTYELLGVDEPIKFGLMGERSRPQ